MVDNNPDSYPDRRQTSSHREWVKVADCKIDPSVQRPENPRLSARIAAEFDLDKLGIPVLNKRGGAYWIVDGQHRLAALRLMGWADMQIECEVFDDLAHAKEAELFLGRNDRIKVRVVDSYFVALEAGREPQRSVDRCVRTQGLAVSRTSKDGIAAVDTLIKVYNLAGEVILGKTLRVIRDSYPHDGAAFHAPIIMGVGLFCHRHGDVPEDEMVEKLAKIGGGSYGLISNANVTKRALRRSLPDCVASAVVDAVNHGRTGRNRLPSWWA